MTRHLIRALSALLLLGFAAPAFAATHGPAQAPTHAAAEGLAQDAKAGADKKTKDAKTTTVVETEDDKKNLDKHKKGDDISDEDMERLRALGYVE